MASVLLVAEIFEGEVKSATLTAVSFARDAAKRLGGEVHILALGSGIDAAANELAKYAAAVKKVDSAELEHAVAESYASVISQVAKDYEMVVMAATTQGKDVMPRAAALLSAGMASDIIGFASDAGLQLKRPIQAGNVIATVEIKTDKKLVTTRPTDFDAAEPLAAAGAVEALSVSAGAVKTSFKSLEKSVSERPELTDAAIVVSGGRGLRDAASFKKLIEPLADKLGAAIGASRAVVDTGWVPNDLQVGQTGKVVAPNLYIAVGISGAIQHVAGMKGSKTIVAINKDPEAPIFQVADYGLVEDLFKAVPELLEKI